MDRIIKLGYDFRDSKIWDRIYEDELFAVELRDGRVGYCCIMGRNGEHMALSVYIGQEALSSLREMMETDPSEASMVEMLRQDCVQLSVERKEELTNEEWKALKDYCKKTGRAFRTPYPHFARYYPHCIPWSITDQADWDALEDALTVVSELTKRDRDELGLRAISLNMSGEVYIPTRSDLFEQIGTDFDKAINGIFDMDDEKEPGDEESVTIPLYSIRDGELHIERTTLPPYKERLPEEPSIVSDLSLFRLSKIKQNGTFQCEIVRLPEPVNGEPPYLPAILLTVDEDGMVLPAIHAEGAVYDPDKLLDEFINMLSKAGVHPEKILLRTNETERLLKGFGRRAGIKVAKRKKLDLLDEAKDSMIEYFSRNGQKSNDAIADEIIGMLSDLSVNEMREMMPSAFLRELLEDMGEYLPPEITEKLQKALAK